MYTRIKKRFDIQVTAPDTVFTKSFDLDKTIIKIHGIAVTSTRDDLIFYRGEQRIEINKEEIFPQEYESKMLMSTPSVPVNGRYYDLGGIPPGNCVLKVDYRDTTYDPAIPFVAYRFSVYLDYEIADQ